MGRLTDYGCFLTFSADLGVLASMSPLRQMFGFPSRPLCLKAQD